LPAPGANAARIPPYSAVKSPLRQLLWLSHEIGRESRELVQLAEGNVSARVDSDRFLVKAAGTPLATLTPSEVVECHAKRILALLETPLMDLAELDRALVEARVDPQAKLPSPEAAFHSILLQLEGVHFVAHCSPISCLQIVCSRMGEAFAEQRLYPEQVLDCGASSVFVPYSDPGSPLAREIQGRITVFMRRNHGPAPRLILLQNRGIVALGATPQAVLNTILSAEKAARVFVGTAALGGPAVLKPGQIQKIEQPTGLAPRARFLKQ